MGQVNTIPKGFLDIFDAQQQGKNPPVYADAVSPIIDATKLYEARTLGVASVLLSHQVVGEIATFAIPDGETWEIVAVGSSSLTALITEFEQIEWSVQNAPRNIAAPPGQGAFHVSPAMVPLAAVALLMDGFTLPRPLVLQAGVELVMRIAQRDASPTRNTTLTITAHVLRG